MDGVDRRVGGVGMARVAWLLGIVWMGACRCDPAAPPPRVDPAPHFPSFVDLVDVAARGQVGAAPDVLDRLTGLSVVGKTEAEREASDRVGAAFGFARFAEDADELIDAVVSMAEGCGGCHEAAGVRLTRRLPWSHPQGARWALQWLVFPGVPSALVHEDPRLAGVAQAWSSSAGVSVPQAAAAAMATCAACHDGS